MSTPDRNGSGGLTSLLELMKPFYADLIFTLGRDVANIATEYNRPSWADTTIPKKQAKALIDRFKGARKDCRAIGLSLSVVTLTRVINTLANEPCVYSFVHRSMDELYGRIYDELFETLFLHIPSEHAERYREPFKSWGTVPTRFPSTTINIEEAGKCLACNRGTACVYHLMRVMESGLEATSRFLGIPYAPSWESHLKQIDDRISIKHKKKGIHWKRDEPFLRDVAAHLRTVKVAWRNPTMHIVRDYTPEAAEEVMNAVITFMKHLATRLTDPPQKTRTQPRSPLP